MGGIGSLRRIWMVNQSSADEKPSKKASKSKITLSDAFLFSTAHGASAEDQVVEAIRQRAKKKAEKDDSQEASADADADHEI